MKKLLIILFSILSFHSYATLYFFTPANVNVINNTTFKPKDDITLQAGVVWSNVHLSFKGNGTVIDSIKIHGEYPGGITVKNGTWIELKGSYMSVSDFNHTGTFDTSQGNAAITFTSASSHIFLWNCNFDDYNYNVGHDGSKFSWLTIQGTYQKVMYCSFNNMTQGRGIKIPAASNQHDTIMYNYFGVKPSIGVNGGEWIRNGAIFSDGQFDAFNFIGYNYFELFDGEQECISNKTSYNTYAYNYFHKVRQFPISIRQGHYSNVNHNWFIGDTTNTGGVKLYGDHNTVEDNYFANLQGTSINASIVLFEGAADDPDGTHTSFEQCRDILIRRNIFVNAVQNIVVGYDYDGANGRILDPDSVTFKNNIYQGNPSGRQWDSVITAKSNFFYDSNYVDPAIPVLSGAAVIPTSPQLALDGLGIYRLTLSSPALTWTDADYFATRGSTQVPISRDAVGAKYANVENRIYLRPGTDGGLTSNGNSTAYTQNDTLVLRSVYSPYEYVNLISYAGSSTKKLTLIGEGNVTVKSMALTNVSNFKIVGRNLTINNLLKNGKSTGIHVDSILATNITFNQDALTDTSYNYPNWTSNNDTIHDVIASRIKIGSDSVNSQTIGGVKYIPQRTTNIAVYNNEAGKITANGATGVIHDNDIDSIFIGKSSSFTVNNNNGFYLSGRGYKTNTFTSNVMDSIVTVNDGSYPLDSVTYIIKNNTAKVKLYKTGTGVYSIQNLICNNSSLSVDAGITYTNCSDVTVPHFSTSNIANGATNIPVTQTITFDFDEDVIEPDNTTFYISPSASVSVLRHSTKLNRWRMFGTLASNTTYTVTAVNVKDLNNNVQTTPTTRTFTTAVVGDTIKPFVSDTFPLNGAAKVPLTTTPVLTMSEAINPLTVSATNARLYNSNNVLIGFGELQADSQTIVFNHAIFDKHSTYSVKLFTGITDKAGNHLAADFVSSFTTADSAPKAIIQSQTQVILPQNGSVSVTLDGSNSTGSVYKFTQTSGKAVTVNNSTTKNASATFTQAGDYTFKLVVTNLDGDKDSTEQSISVIDAPVIYPSVIFDADKKTVYQPQDTVSLDGHLSHDNNDPAYPLKSVKWSVPNNIGVTIDNTDTSVTVLRGIAGITPQIIPVDFTITDTKGNTSTGRMLLYVYPDPSICTCEDSP